MNAFENNSQRLFSLGYCSFIHTVEQVESAVFHRPGEFSVALSLWHGDCGAGWVGQNY